MVVVPMKGSTFAEIIQYSRRYAAEGREFGGFYQCDRGVLFDEADPTKVVGISFEPMDPERVYWVAAPIGPLEGMEKNLPLLQWAAENSDKIPTEEHTWPGRKNTKAAIVANQIKRVWHHTWEWAKLPKIEGKHGDRVLGPEEVRSAVRAILGHVPVNDLAMNNVFRWGDRRGAGEITVSDFLVGKLKAMVCHGKQQCCIWYKNLSMSPSFCLQVEKDIKPLCYEALAGKGATREEVGALDPEYLEVVDHVCSTLDRDSDGLVSRGDVLRWQQDVDIYRSLSHGGFNTRAPSLRVTSMTFGV